MEGENVDKSTRTFVLWLIIALLIWAVFSSFQGSGGENQRSEFAFSDFIAQVENDNVREVVIQGKDITGVLHDGTPFHTYAPDDPNLVERLEAKGVTITALPPEGGSLFSMLIGWLPMLLLIGVWIWFMRRMQSGKGMGMGFGKSKARLLDQNLGRVTFADVAGVDEAKQELEEVVEFLKTPKKFQLLGGKIPKGVLLVGPTGTGKTLLARAIAGEANVPFFTISGSDFVELFVGVGASRVRDMFEQGKKNAPCIIFIDEIDAVGRHRGAGLGGGNDEREQTLNQLLVEMDGFETNEGVILIAATNRPDVLDPALLRPGRFDRQVVVPLPDVVGREKILKIHVREMPLALDVKLKVIARGTPGFSGADLANLANEAALLAARKGKHKVSMAEFEEAKDKVMMGTERRSMVMTEEEKELTAYHESGHALVCIHVPGNDPVHKVTIIPRGRALGLTMALPEGDRYGYRKMELEAKMAMMFGGRVAEEIIFGKENITTGAADDIKKATELARKMVAEYGMSEKLGPRRYEASEEEIFIGRLVTQHKEVSDATTKLIDDEISRLIDEARGRAEKVLTEHIEELHALAKALLEYETLTGKEIQDVLDEKPIKRPEEDETRETPPKETGPRTSVPSSGGENPVSGGPGFQTES